jgi:hypothetical protein
MRSRLPSGAAAAAAARAGERAAGGDAGAAGAGDPGAREAQPRAAVVGERLHRVRVVVDAARGAGVGVGMPGEVGEAAVQALELGEAGDHLGRAHHRLVGHAGVQRPVGREQQRFLAGRAGEGGGAGAHAFDRLGAEADLFDEDAGGEVFGHGSTFRGKAR